MLRNFFFTIFILSVLGVQGQKDYIPPSKNRAVQKVVTQEGDTILAVDLREVEIPSDQQRKEFYTDLGRMIYNVKKVYPYAKITSEIINEYDSIYDQFDRKRDRKRFMRQVEKDLKDEFEDELKNLTVTQGRILIKLINRETGVTSYDLIKNLKGGLSAFLWQGVAKLFGSNLKDEFQKDRDDVMLEYIVRRIERGEIYVSPRERKTKLDLSNLDI